MDYEDIVKARRIIETLKQTFPVASDDFQSLISVIDYADGEYVNHCEEIGRIAIEDIKKMKDEWIDAASEFWHSKMVDEGYNSYQRSKIIDEFKETMKNK